MQQAPCRETVDLSGYPDLVVILLGLQARRLRAFLSLRDVGRGLAAIQRTPPDGLLSHQSLRFGWNHVGFRQYWRDYESLEAFTRAAPHADWWRHFMQQGRGCGFWHEAYSARGGMEAIYVDMPQRTGFAAFAPVVAPEGRRRFSRARLAEHAGRAAAV
ncbi:hypothetical protein NCH01_21540 [Neoasaia chiangmaiensis]|uniref:Uncharacterized protein n=1 Tax=Neoasaia chiangmaiensis TaxID=320497 RepID=A0A1U9KQG1_9PROT|nr:DUF4188 domain-containing protein [Neoasaia chiangmaiensis]AQS88048.1 hypothetical protein A0U93_08935 [Neoasaia chiangmaiensis]GEN15723.1 hypothetical protein NCH01_21540 [Neoasaia chiangmaiensis]